MTMKFIIFFVLIALSQAEFENVATELEVLPQAPRGVVRIVNGQNAAANQFPHQALVFISTLQGTFQCGGSLISSNWVMSAAHCVIG